MTCAQTDPDTVSKGSCCAKGGTADPGPAAAPGGQVLRIPVEGLNCASCVRRAEAALSAAPGVRAASVNLATQSAEIRHDGPVAPALAALAAAGFGVPRDTALLEVEGASCASCVGRIERAAQARPGVVEARMNLATGQLRLVLAGGDAAAVAAAVTDAGYAARPVASDAPQEDRHAREARGLARDLVLSGALTLPVVVLAMGGHLSPAFHGFLGATLGHGMVNLIQFALTTAVLAGPGRRFFRKGIPLLLRRAPDMNALVALGTFSAWAYSTVTVFAPGLLPDGAAHVYFEAAAVIVTLILLGRLLEARAKGRTGAAIRALMDLAPETAHVLLPDGGAEDRPVASLRPGDLIRLRPGERVATDGTVTEGRSHLDEAMITGEPLPVAKAPGDPVTGGTVNGPGSLTYRATAVGADTVLARIVAMVRDAQGAKLPIQALVDRITAWFVPAVMGVAVLTVLGWLIFGPAPALSHALVAGVSVLIIACPCAMGLATPTSIMVGTGRAAEMGVLFRRGDALQALQEVRVVAFDKTGTLTEGRPEVVDLTLAPGVPRAAVLPLLAAAEARSEHPLARAILAFAGPDAGLEVSGFEARAGFGLVATVAGRRLLAGNAALLAQDGVETGALAGAAETAAATGATPVFVALDGQAVALLSIADPVKPTAAAAIAALKARGLRPVLLTGDTEATARAIAATLGIGEVQAGLRPEDKLAAVDALKAPGGPVAFVGDGINDAPALARAELGIALGTGTDVAIEAADVVLTHGDPMSVVTAIGLSRATLHNIRQNLAWAFGYNALLIPVAAGLLYLFGGPLLSPMLAAGAMALSSVFVLGNALRLRQVQPVKDVKGYQV